MVLKQLFSYFFFFFSFYVQIVDYYDNDNVFTKNKRRKFSKPELSLARWRITINSPSLSKHFFWWARRRNTAKSTVSGNGKGSRNIMLLATTRLSHKPFVCLKNKTRDTLIFQKNQTKRRIFSSRAPDDVPAKKFTGPRLGDGSHLHYLSMRATTVARLLLYFYFCVSVSILGFFFVLFIFSTRPQ